MNKISERDIQLFVAGALALIGFRALAGIPYFADVCRGRVNVAVAAQPKVFLV